MCGGCHLVAEAQTDILFQVDWGTAPAAPEVSGDQHSSDTL